MFRALLIPNDCARVLEQSTRLLVEPGKSEGRVYPPNDGSVLVGRNPLPAPESRYRNAQGIQQRRDLTRQGGVRVLVVRFCILLEKKQEFHRRVRMMDQCGKTVEQQAICRAKRLETAARARRQG